MVGLITVGLQFNSKPHGIKGEAELHQFNVTGVIVIIKDDHEMIMPVNDH